jgi:hypothetical protein
MRPEPGAPWAKGQRWGVIDQQYPDIDVWRAYVAAEDAIYRCGWWPGPDAEAALDPEDDATVGRSGSLCIASAVSRTCAPMLAAQALRHLKVVLGLPDDPGSLASWNDAPGRTVSDVIRALRMARDVRREALS